MIIMLVTHFINIWKGQKIDVIYCYQIFRDIPLDNNQTQGLVCSFAYHPNFWYHLHFNHPFGTNNHGPPQQADIASTLYDLNKMDRVPIMPSLMMQDSRRPGVNVLPQGTSEPTKCVSKAGDWSINSFLSVSKLEGIFPTLGALTHFF